ncbi:acetoacetate--CoA ligase [Euzebya sp.]|uniref:acetoacetate--CoA ligase n=1 Tax=Euzebya sp. TaxID=1971409 RepID=UPI0035138435
MSANPILWTPDPQAAAATNLAAFATACGLADDDGTVDYHRLWRWSIAEPDAFWAAAWDRLGVVAARPPDAITEGSGLPGTRWFPGAQLNYAENLLAGDPDDLAVIATGEGREPRRFTVADLRRDVARVQVALTDMGVSAGDRVCAVMPNAVETLVIMLAATGLGAVWSSTSPDFGVQGVVDRFAQVEPAVLVVADGYTYGGRIHALAGKVADVVAALPTLGHVLVVDFAGVGLDLAGPDLPDGTSGPARHDYVDVVADGPTEPTFTPVAADHPLFIMYSSGTTGVPKSIVHGHGGSLVKHLVEHQLHTDLRPGDVIMWFTTCGWMMWNWLVSALASRATVVLYDGSPTTPDAGVLWRLVPALGITHFGTSPKFLAACQAAGLEPAAEADLSSLRAVLSTGAPLTPEQFDWVYAHVAADVQLASVSGGTDLLGCFAGGVPTLPVRRGELQARTLGMAVEAVDEQGRPVEVGVKGELVCTQPFPSTPIGFWGDPDGSRYHDAYFAQHPGVWTHGDFIELRPEGGVVIHGRSDTTLNPGGVRIGTAEIYRAIDGVEEVVDSIVVGREHDGDTEVVLCVQLAEGIALTDELRQRLASRIRQATTPRHVPRHIHAVPAIPYTLSGKKVEKAVRTVLSGGAVDNADALANPESLDGFRGLFDG